MKAEASPCGFFTGLNEIAAAILDRPFTFGSRPMRILLAAFVAVSLSTITHCPASAQEIKKGDFVVLSSDRQVQGSGEKPVTYPTLTILIVDYVEGKEARVHAFNPFTLYMPFTKDLPSGKYKIVPENLMSLDEHIVILTQKRFVAPENDELVRRLLFAHYAKEVSLSDDLDEETQSRIIARCDAEQLALISLLIERNPTDFELLATRARMRREVSNDKLTDRIAKIDFDRAVSLATTLAAKATPTDAQRINARIQSIRRVQEAIELANPVIEPK